VPVIAGAAVTVPEASCAVIPVVCAMVPVTGAAVCGAGLIAIVTARRIVLAA